MVTQNNFQRHFQFAGQHCLMEDVKAQVIDMLLDEARVRE